MTIKHPIARRGFLKAMLAAGAAPWFVPARVLGAAGRTRPSNKLTLIAVKQGRKWSVFAESGATQWSYF